jgi:hypothetical protein
MQFSFPTPRQVAEWSIAVVLKTIGVSPRGSNPLPPLFNGSALYNTVLNLKISISRAELALPQVALVFL